jgi:hypothetical protein
MPSLLVRADTSPCVSLAFRRVEPSRFKPVHGLPQLGEQRKPSGVEQYCDNIHEEPGKTIVGHDRGATACVASLSKLTPLHGNPREVVIVQITGVLAHIGDAMIGNLSGWASQKDLITARTAQPPRSPTNRRIVT